MTKYLRISSYIRKPFLIHDFAPDPFWISLYMMKIIFSFLTVRTDPLKVFSLEEKNLQCGEDDIGKPTECEGEGVDHWHLEGDCL